MNHQLARFIRRFNDGGAIYRYVRINIAEWLAYYIIHEAQSSTSFTFPTAVAVTRLGIRQRRSVYFLKPIIILIATVTFPTSS